eukprot:TRINITY_DN42819_c0_g1_i1.p1 TRINITY_DN42819_c0_g1~~TRINITY_DN42819_c0_g1_i1.p1  ORF type:complete len:156 (-),score=30.04 TRINITY_DN42819_c0_g1_i1:86-553(-)
MVDQPRVQRTHTDITREINSSPAGILLNTSDLLLLEWMIHVISSAATDGCWAFLLFVQANAIATIWDLGSLVIVCLWGYKCGLEVGNGFLRIAYIALLLWGVFLFLAADGENHNFADEVRCNKCRRPRQTIGVLIDQTVTKITNNIETLVLKSFL